MEKIREVPEQVTRYQGRARETVGKYQGEVRETVDRYRYQVRETVDRYRGEFSKYQDRVDAKDLPGAAVAYATHFGTRAVEFIDELAERGKKVVHREAVEVAEIAEADAKPGPEAPQRAGPHRAAARQGRGADADHHQEVTPPEGDGARARAGCEGPAENTRPGFFVFTSRRAADARWTVRIWTVRIGLGGKSRVRDEESPSETSRSADRRCRASTCWTTSSGCC